MESHPPYSPTAISFIERVHSRQVNGLRSGKREPFVPALEVNQQLKKSKQQVRVMLEEVSHHPVDIGTVQNFYGKVFTILIEIGRGDYIDHFIKHSHSDDSLPLLSPPSGLEVLCTADSGFFAAFQREQWKFCAPIFTYEGLQDKHFDSHVILPIVSCKKIGEGGTANLYEITLYEDHDRLARDQSADAPVGNRYILKTFRSRDAEKHYHAEREAHLHLRSKKEHPYIVRYYGSFRHGDTFNIILEYADHGDLEMYFRTVDPPTKGQDIISFSQQIFKLAVAVMHIQGLEAAHGFAQHVLRGFHQDLKPKNILVLSGGKSNPYEFQFKIADFGTTHFKKGPSVDNTTDVDARGSLAYAPPECHRSNAVVDMTPLQVNPSVDIWSLGCIWLECFVWIVFGRDALQRFRKERLQEAKEEGLDDGECFHKRDSVLEAVENAYERLRSPEKRPIDCVTVPAVDLIKDMIVVDPHFRLHANGVTHKTDRIIKEAQLQLDKIYSTTLNPSPTVGSTSNAKFNASYYPSPPNPTTPIDRPPMARNQAYIPESAFDDVMPFRSSPKFGMSQSSKDGNPGFKEPQHDSPISQGPQPGRSSWNGSTTRNSGSFREQIPGRHQFDNDDLDSYRPESSKRLSSKRSGMRKSVEFADEPTHPCHPQQRQPSTYLNNQSTSAHPYLLSNLNGGKSTSMPSSIHSSINRRQSTPSEPSYRLSQNNMVPSYDLQEALHDRGHHRTGAQSSMRRASNNSGHDRENLVARLGYRDLYNTHPNATRPFPQAYESRTHPPVHHHPSHRLPRESFGNVNLPSERPPYYGLGDYPELDSEGEENADMEIDQPVTEPRMQVSMEHLPTRQPHRPLSPVPVCRLHEAQRYIDERKNGRIKHPRIPHPQYLHDLDKRDHVFILDNSLTMNAHRDQAICVLGILARLLKRTDKNGLDLYFTVEHPGYRSHIREKDASPLEKAANNIPRLEKSDISIALGKVLQPYELKIKSQENAKKWISTVSGPVKPMTVYVLTDGLWTEASDPTELILNMVKTLQNTQSAGSRQLGIEFIQFGNDANASRKLERLDKLKNHYPHIIQRDIVDSTTYDEGNVWKMIYGSIDKKFDND